MKTEEIAQFIRDASEKKVTSLVLSFPHGATYYQIRRIAEMTESIVIAGISSGGFTSENSMEYKYSYDHTCREDQP